ncbi:MAG: hypothetical protein LBV72_05860 [Tannerella sp.]|jgi:hypothetical protein|nr:hypothetical protein [Tannerella sp.]
MNFKTKLSKRIQMHDIHAIIFAIQNNPKQIKKIYDLVFDPDETVAYQAAWVLTHLSSQDNQWLYDRQNDLIEEVLICPHPGKRRIILALLYRQPSANPPRTDFLDFCLERMVSRTELPGVQTLCIKLAYELCLTIPELLQEFRFAIELIEPDLLPASLRAVHRNIRKAMKTGKSLNH